MPCASKYIRPGLITFLSLCISISPAFPAGPESADSSSQMPFHLEHADIFQQKNDSTGSQYYVLQGQVDVTRGESRILCGSLSYFPASSYLLCLDSVHLSDPERDLRSDSLLYYLDREYYRAAGSVRWASRGIEGSGRSGEYFRDRGLMRLEGEAEARDSLRRIDADVLEYESASQVLRALGNVRMLEYGSRSTARSASAVYNRDKGTAVLTGRPEIVYYEKGDSLSPYHLVSDLLRRFGPDSVVAVGRVRLWRDSLTVTADSLFHNLGIGISYFRGGPPLVLDPKFNLRGMEIDVQTASRKLRRVSALGSARGEFRPDSSQTAADSAASGPAPAGPAPAGSWITGDTLDLYFGASGIDSLASSGGSRSYFRESAESGVNYILGRWIKLAWENGVVARVQVDGGGRGLFVLPDSSLKQAVPDSAATVSDSVRTGKQ